LPELRDSLVIPGGGFLNNRGLFLPQPVLLPGARWTLMALVIGILAAIVFRVWARRRQYRTGQPAPVLWVALGLVIAMPLIVLALSGMPIQFVYPSGRFNIRGASRSCRNSWRCCSGS
jgi:general L-amino acid transport system permease protein